MTNLPVIRRDPETGQDLVVPDPPGVELRRAQSLDRRIRLLVGAINDSVEKLYGLVDQVSETESYKVLGYKTLADYLADVFVIPARLDRCTRREVVAFLSEHINMSQRQIGSVIGVDHKTVGNDLRDIRGEFSPPEDVVVIDQVPVDVPGNPTRKPPRPPLPAAARSVSVDLSRINKKLSKLIDDDRFMANRESIGNTMRHHVAEGEQLLSKLSAVIQYDPNDARNFFPALISTLEVTAVAVRLPQPEIREIERVQHRAAIRDLLDAIEAGLRQWEADL